MCRRMERPSGTPEMRNIRAINHHSAQQRELRQGPTEQPKVLAKHSTVEGQRFKSAPSGGRQIRIIVRVDLDRSQANRRLALEVGNRLVSASQERTPCVLIEAAVDSLLKVQSRPF